MAIPVSSINLLTSKLKWTKYIYDVKTVRVGTRYLRLQCPICKDKLVRTWIKKKGGGEKV